MAPKLAKKRNCIKEKNVDAIGEKTKRICVPLIKEEYEYLFKAKDFREKLDSLIEEFPELFPIEIKAGYKFHDIRECKKISLRLRRIKLKKNSEVYTIMPSSVMPYITAEVAEVENPLLLRKFGVPYWVLTLLFGRNDMFWYRLENRLGRCSLVGTTLRNEENLPKLMVSYIKNLGYKIFLYPLLWADFAHNHKIR